MTPEQSAAYVNGQVACALIEMEAMKAENAMRELRGESPAYGFRQFFALTNKYAIAHNAVCSAFKP